MPKPAGRPRFKGTDPAVTATGVTTSSAPPVAAAIREDQEISSNENGSSNGTRQEYYIQASKDGKDSRMLSNGHGRIHYIGESCILSLLEQIRQLFRQIDGPTKFTENPERFVLVDGPDYKASKPVLLPSRADVDHLMWLFESHIHCIIYVFDWEMFKVEVDEVYKDPIRAAETSLCRLYLVLAIGSVFEEPYEDQHGADATSRLFFQSALFYMDELAMSTGDVWIVEAHLLISTFYELQFKRNMSWIHLGMGFRQAQCLGLCSVYANKRFPPRIRQHRGALWKSICIQEQLRSTSLGRPAMSCSVTSTHDTENPALSQFSMLCSLLGDIRASIYETDSISSSTAQRLISSLKDWSSSFEHLVKGQVSHNAQGKGLLGVSKELPWNKKFLLTLNLSYLHCIVLLTRPFLFYVVAKKVKSNSSRVDPALGTFENLAQTCVQSCLTSVKLLNDFYSIGSHPQRSSLMIYYTLTCGVMLLLDSFQRQSVEPNVNWAVNCSISMLSEYSKADRSARRYYDILNEMRDAVSHRGGLNNQNLFSNNIAGSTNSMPDLINSPSFNSISVNMPESNNSSPFDFGNLNIDEVVDNWSFTPLGPILGTDGSFGNQHTNSDVNNDKPAASTWESADSNHLLQNMEPPEALLLEPMSSNK